MWDVVLPASDRYPFRARCRQSRARGPVGPETGRPPAEGLTGPSPGCSARGPPLPDGDRLGQQQVHGPGGTRHASRHRRRGRRLTSGSRRRALGGPGGRAPGHRAQRGARLASPPAPGIVRSPGPHGASVGRTDPPGGGRHRPQGPSGPAGHRASRVRRHGRRPGRRRRRRGPAGSGVAGPGSRGRVRDGIRVPACDRPVPEAGGAGAGGAERGRRTPAGRGRHRSGGDPRDALPPGRSGTGPRPPLRRTRRVRLRRRPPTRHRPAGGARLQGAGPLPPSTSRRPRHPRPSPARRRAPRRRRPPKAP